MSETSGSNFIRDAVRADLAEGRFQQVVTRFPPEPNGYLHIGHAKAICIDFGIAQEFGGVCNLRFDDTNPVKEEQEFMDAIEENVRWLGFDWGERLFFASDYFEQMYEWAIQLIKDGKAYVDDQTADEIRQTRGTLTEPGTSSPHPTAASTRVWTSSKNGSRGVPRRLPRLAGEDRHGLPELEPEGPGDVPHPGGSSSTDRQPLERLPHVRLGAWP